MMTHDTSSSAAASTGAQAALPARPSLTYRSTTAEPHADVDADVLVHLTLYALAAEARTSNRSGPARTRGSPPRLPQH